MIYDAVKTLNDASAAGSLAANILIYVPTSNDATTATSITYKTAEYTNSIKVDGTAAARTPIGATEAAAIGNKFVAFNTAQ